MKDLRLTLRPPIPAAGISENMSNEERFQNRSLRPILKLQHDLLIAVFKNHLKKKKNTFFELSKEAGIEYIERLLLKDTRLRSELQGIVIGQFTLEEYQEYSTNSSALNKRLMNMLKERIKSSFGELFY